MKQYRIFNNAMVTANHLESGMSLRTLMKSVNRMKKLKKSNSILNFTLLIGFFLFVLPTNIFAQEVLWKKNFGGSGADEYLSATEVPDGIIAVGCSRDWSFGNGDWVDVSGNGNYDAIIVKYDYDGNVVWKKNFGGIDFDYFYSVTSASDGVIAVGDSYSFDSGDWEGVMGKGGGGDATIVKFDYDGNIVWKKNFGGSGHDRYEDAVVVSDGIIAVGTSEYRSFDNGDWKGVSGRIDNDAIIVKYDHNGNVLWKKSFGTNHRDWYESVTAVSDGVVAVGHKYNYIGYTYNGAIIVKYDNAGNLLWDKVLDDCKYYSVTTTSDGVIAVGAAGNNAIMVKYDNNGNVLWKKNFQGSYEYVTAVDDGIIVSGYAYVENFGDWAGFVGHGAQDAILVKYDFDGNIIWKKHFGGKGYDIYHSAIAVSDAIIAIGESYDLLGSGSSFGNGDLEGVAGKGAGDAIIVKYTTSGTGIMDVSKMPNLRIYPNPAQEIVFVECESISAIKLYDMLGKEVLSQSATGNAEINISHLPQGIYNVVLLSDNENVVAGKIVKQ